MESNYRALRLRYLPETDEFDVHSPTLSATKWWPGALGRSANHAIVYARLLVGERDLGIHNFLVQIRDVATHVRPPYQDQPAYRGSVARWRRHACM